MVHQRHRSSASFRSRSFGVGVPLKSFTGILKSQITNFSERLGKKTFFVFSTLQGKMNLLRHLIFFAHRKMNRHSNLNESIKQGPLYIYTHATKQTFSS